MRGLAGKRVLISGGSSGIGLAAARRFLEEGCRVFIAGLAQAEVDRALAELRPAGDIAGAACDVSREDDVTAMVRAADHALGGIDVLANNAGTGRRDPFLAITPGDWDRSTRTTTRPRAECCC
jgi:3-oxoacyl-[acyl-carrier protein] reductase